MDPSAIVSWLYIIETPYAPSSIVSWEYIIIEDTVCPVDWVTWYDCAMFCNLLGAREGLHPYYDFSNIVRDGNNIISATIVENTGGLGWNGYRLPTVTEWVYCAKKGSESAIYSGSDIIDDVAWYIENSLSTYSTIDFPMFHPVGLKNSNVLGFKDMTGNVFEWLNENVEGNTKKIIIGGSFNSTHEQCEILYFETRFPSERAKNIGFRPVKTI